MTVRQKGFSGKDKNKEGAQRKLLLTTIPPTITTTHQARAWHCEQDSLAQLLDWALSVL